MLTNLKNVIRNAGPKAGQAAKAKPKPKVKKGAANKPPAVATRIKISQALRQAARTLKGAMPGEARKRNIAEIAQIRQIMENVTPTDPFETSVSGPTNCVKNADAMALLAGGPVTATGTPEAGKPAVAPAPEAVPEQAMPVIEKAEPEAAAPADVDWKAKLANRPRPQTHLRPRFAPSAPVSTTSSASPDNQVS